ncbi:MAG: hypothetical protein II496_06800 [Clostridiales bacterium]|nr:hypothetical protein [Clostridiales bacterium]
MPDTNDAPLTQKCSICGGDLVSDYLAGVLICEHCNNKWPIQKAMPDYSKYDRIISNINKADEILTSDQKIASANEAKILFKQAIMECGNYNDEVTNDLIRKCEDGMKEADLLAQYYKGKNAFDHRSYSNAISELAKVPGYRDSDELVMRSKAELEAQRKRQLPLTIILSTIIPLSLAIALKEFAGWHIVICILIFLAGSAGLGYVMYQGKIPSLIIKIISFLAATPLILFCIFAYAFHLAPWLAALIAIGAPIVLFAVTCVLSETNKD